MSRKDNNCEVKGSGIDIDIAIDRDRRGVEYKSARIFFLSAIKCIYEHSTAILTVTEGRLENKKLWCN